MNERNALLKELHIDRAQAPVSRRRWIIALSSIALMLIAALVFWRLNAPPTIAREVITAKAISATNNASILDATGYVTARRMATVSSKITGKVKEVMIEEGQHVEAGQIMATLDPIDAQAQRQLAASQLASARSQLVTLQTQLNQAQTDAKRYQELLQRQLVSHAQVEQVLAQRDTLQAQLETAQRNMQVAADQLHIADNGVDNTIVRAPFSGVVTAKAAQPGEIVSPLSAGGGFTRTGIGTLVDMDSLEIEVDVNEAYIGRVQAKMPVDAVLNAYPDWRIPAEVIAIIPSANRSKATVKVRIALKSKDPRIVPDMGVKVSFLETPKAEDVNANKDATIGVSIPASTIIQRDGSSVVFVVDAQSKIERRAISVGRSMGDERQVVAGLRAGETVIKAATTDLQDGAAIRVASGESVNK